MKTALGLEKLMLLALLSVLLLRGCGGGDDNLYLRDGSGAFLTGDYLGQELPGDKPVLFAPGIVSTGMFTRDLTMTPDGSEIYFSVNVGSFDYTAVMVSRRTGGRWTRPEVAEFSSDPDFKVAEPFISPDGERLYFISDAVTGSGDEGHSGTAAADEAGSEEPEKNYDIWAVDREGEGWGDPYRLEGPFNTADNEFFPTVTRTGNLYFCRAEPSTGIHYLYRSRFENGEYQEVEKLPSEVNSGRSMFNATISPDEDFIIVPVFGRQDGEGGVDYYLSFRDADDRWTGPVNMGGLVNTPGSQEYSANLSPDGKYLFFMSRRTKEDEDPVTYEDILGGMDEPEHGNPAIYWMKADIIERLRSGEEVPGTAAAGEDDTDATGSADAGNDPAPPAREAARTLELPGTPYLGQDPPGMTPVLFAPGIVSNGLYNRDCIANADGTEMFIGLMHGGVVTVLWTRLVDGKWTGLEMIPFSVGADYAVFEPALSPDGNSLYFLTNKAAPGQELKPGWGNQNIFVSDRNGDSWSEPYPAPGPITSDDNDYYPSITRDGTIYYTHHRRGEPGAIWRSRLVDGQYGEPEKLGPEVNCGHDTYNAFVAFDESYIIVCANGRDDLIGDADYYIAFRSEEDVWTGPFNMGEPINLPGSSASSSFVTRDGRYFFFSSDRTDDGKNIPGGKLTAEVLRRLYEGPQNGHADIYWVDAAVIDDLRPQGY